MNNIKIKNKNIGGNNRTFIIAEAGINHNGNIDIAKELISAAVESKADAIKFQIYDTESFYSDKHKGFIQTGKNIIKLLKSLEFKDEEWFELKGYADKLNILFFASIFDDKSFELALKLDLPIYKIASGDITYLPFLKKIANTKKPVILSTGMSNIKEIASAVETFEKNRNRQISILQCVSLYPAPYDLMNLKSIRSLYEIFGYPTGLSDHTEGYHISLAAVAMGAKIIEKHFTMDKSMKGPDHKLSLSPNEFKNMVKQIRDIEYAVGNGFKKGAVGDEKKNLSLARRGLYATEYLKKGDIIKADNTIFKRPALDYIKPDNFKIIKGKKIKKNKKKGEGIKYSDIL